MGEIKAQSPAAIDWQKNNCMEENRRNWAEADTFNQTNVNSHYREPGR